MPAIPGMLEKLTPSIRWLRRIGAVRRANDPLYMRTLFEELDYVFDERRTEQLLVAVGIANASFCLEQRMFEPPSRSFYPCTTLQVLRRRRPLRGEGRLR